MSVEQRFRAALLQLAVWSSEGATMNPGSGAGSGKPGHVVLWSGSGMELPDVRVWVVRWERCRTPATRLAVCVDLERAVRELREPPARERASESDGERKARVLADTKGWSPEDVARSRHGVTAREIRRWRKAANLDTETGEPSGARLSPVQRRREVAILYASGVESPTEIARRIGEPNHWNVMRDLRWLRNGRASA